MAGGAESSCEEEWIPVPEHELFHRRAEGFRQAQREYREAVQSQKPEDPRCPRIVPSGKYSDIPVVEDDDYYFMGHRGEVPPNYAAPRAPFYASPKPAYFDEYERSCREDQVLLLQQTISQNSCSVAMLHHGLILALESGSVECAHELLRCGTPIAKRAPESLLSAPRMKQIPLLDTLLAYGWDPTYDLFMKCVPDIELVQWFLAHGTDPNYGIKRDRPDKAGGPSYECADALERAASKGSAAVIDILIAAGAKIEFGHPLHIAAMVLPPNHHPYSSASQPEDFDASLIPTMAALVAHSADVNEREDTPHVTVEYPLLYAVKYSAVQRARWLLEHGADLALTPTGRPSLTAAAMAKMIGNLEMIELLDSHIRLM